MKKRKKKRKIRSKKMSQGRKTRRLINLKISIFARGSLGRTEWNLESFEIWKFLNIACFKIEFYIFVFYISNRNSKSIDLKVKLIFLQNLPNSQVLKKFHHALSKFFFLSKFPYNPLSRGEPSFQTWLAIVVRPSIDRREGGKCKRRRKKKKRKKSVRNFLNATTSRFY